MAMDIKPKRTAISSFVLLADLRFIVAIFFFGLASSLFIFTQGMLASLIKRSAIDLTTSFIIALQAISTFTILVGVGFVCLFLWIHEYNILNMGVERDV